MNFQVEGGLAMAATPQKVQENDGWLTQEWVSHVRNYAVGRPSPPVYIQAAEQEDEKEEVKN